MKDFLKWLGINERIAKIVIWIFLFMISIITLNAFLNSFGIHNFEFTYDNVSNINIHIVIEYLISWIMCVISFYSLVLPIFRAKEFKNTLNYAMIFLLGNIVINSLFGYVISQIFIVLYFIIFCYLFSGKSKKYILYAIISMIINLIVQYVCYLIKIIPRDFYELNQFTKIMSGLDYFVIIVVIIIIKEIILSKRGEKNGKLLSMVGKIRQ